MHIRIAFLLINKFVTEKPLIAKINAMKRKAMPAAVTATTDMKAMLENEKQLLENIHETIIQ